MKPAKSFVVASLLSTGVLGTFARADSVASSPAGQRPAAQVWDDKASSALQEVRLVPFGNTSAVWNMNQSRTIEATVSYVDKDGDPQSVVLTLGPGQKVPYKLRDEGGNSHIRGARYVN